MAASSFKGCAGRDMQLYGHGPLRFADTDDRGAPCPRPSRHAGLCQRARTFEAIVRMQRDLLSQRWILSEKIYHSCLRPPAVGNLHRAKTNR